MMSEERRMRCREAGIVIGTLPTGPTNSLTDVPDVRVGHTTVSFADERGVARTGVTAIWPASGDLVRWPVPAGSFVLAGFGEITGRAAVAEWGVVSTPILLTATMHVGIVYHAALQYLCARDPALGRGELVIPVVGECDDSFLNDARAFHVQPEHVFAALDGAHSGPVEEGCVGAGTGMQCFEFKGGIGSASRLVTIGDRQYTVGVLVETNLGARELLTIDGVPVGRNLTDLMPEGRLPDYWGAQRNGGSCIVIVGTDAPLSSAQLAKVAKRAALGLGRVGSIGANSSGELLLAFSNANRVNVATARPYSVEAIHERSLDAVYQATVEATEEAVINALFTATTTIGRDGNTLYALPIDRALELMRRHRRLAEG